MTKTIKENIRNNTYVFEVDKSFYSKEYVSLWECLEGIKEVIKNKDSYYLINIEVK